MLPSWYGEQGTSFNLPPWAAAARFPTCPGHRAHTASMSNSFVLGVKFVACYCGHPSAGSAQMAVVESECVTERKLLRVMTWLL